MATSLSSSTSYGVVISASGNSIAAQYEAQNFSANSFDIIGFNYAGAVTDITGSAGADHLMVVVLGRDA